jgi:hypothetical protein
MFYSIETFSQFLYVYYIFKFVIVPLFLSCYLLMAVCIVKYCKIESFHFSSFISNSNLNIISNLLNKTYVKVQSWKVEWPFSLLILLSYPTVTMCVPFLGGRRKSIVRESVGEREKREWNRQSEWERKERKWVREVKWLSGCGYGSGCL